MIPIDNLCTGLRVRVLDPGEEPEGWDGTMFDFVGEEATIEHVEEGSLEGAGSNAAYVYCVYLDIDDGEWVWRPFDLEMIETLKPENPNSLFKNRNTKRALYNGYQMEYTKKPSESDMEKMMLHRYSYSYKGKAFGEAKKKVESSEVLEGKVFDVSDAMQIYMEKSKEFHEKITAKYLPDGTRK